MTRPKKQYTVQLEEDVVDRIDKLAKKLGHNRSQMMRNLLLQGLEDGEMIDKTGLFSAVIFSKNILTKFKESVLKGELFLDKHGNLKINR
ncbi:MAG TPA: ribbon-helix-helix domain-containing protein [Smithellaceae bacterium]|nr:ribbon-helix-helix domain-containing protein [Smithellaceae bacterium]